MCYFVFATSRLEEKKVASFCHLHLLVNNGPKPEYPVSVTLFACCQVLVLSGHSGSVKAISANPLEHSEWNSCVLRCQMNHRGLWSRRV